PDVMLTLCVAIAFWSFAHCLDPDEPHQSRWAALLALSFGTGLLFKGLIAVVLPLGGILAYMVISRQLFSASVWSRLHPLRGLGIILVVAL
ncbi:glycosyl transferase, partial [Pseudomonas sp. FW305-BF8]|uniref:glycosyltransferase family 39 protein n=1 Tax=Pseudomonas sp. FW305-BF8 TaxID=2070602 RepID=UPI000CB82E14